jgi:hypothetical protein
MLFRESFITDAGSRLLERAIAQEGAVIWTAAATSSLNSDSMTDAQMNALDTATFGTKTSSGAVTNAIVNDEQRSVSIHCELTNAEYYGMARTLGVWAKIQGDAQDVLVVVARCGEGVTPTYINPASEGVVKAFVDFSLEITDEQAQAVSVAEGYYATSTALQQEISARESLAERVVTTHSATDASVGDGQNILGQKSFHMLPMMIGDLNATANWIFADYTPMIMAKKGKCIYRVYNDNYNNINSIYVSGHFYYNDTTKINHGVSAEDNAQTGEVTVTDYLKKNGTQTCWLKKETDTDGRGSIGMYIRDRDMNYPYGIKLYENTTSYYADIYSYMVNIKAGRDVKIISQSNEIELRAVNIKLEGGIQGNGGSASYTTSNGGFSVSTSRLPIGSAPRSDISLTAKDGAFNVVAYTASTHEYRGDLTISGHNGTGGNVKPAADGTQTLGTASYEWSDVYTKNLHVATTIVPDNGNANIGDTSNRFDNVYASMVDATMLKPATIAKTTGGTTRYVIVFDTDNISPQTDMSVSLGKSAKRYDAIYSRLFVGDVQGNLSGEDISVDLVTATTVETTKLKGLAPKLTNGTLTVPIGGIIMGKRYSGTAWTADTTAPGVKITIASNTVVACAIDGNHTTAPGTTGLIYLPAGDYVFISHGYVSPNEKPALLMRVA